MTLPPGWTAYGFRARFTLHGGWYITVVACRVGVRAPPHPAEPVYVAVYDGTGELGNEPRSADVYFSSFSRFHRRLSDHLEDGSGPLDLIRWLNHVHKGQEHDTDREGTSPTGEALGQDEERAEEGRQEEGGA